MELVNICNISMTNDDLIITLNFWCWGVGLLDDGWCTDYYDFVVISDVYNEENSEQGDHLTPRKLCKDVMSWRQSLLFKLRQNMQGFKFAEF